MFPPPVSLHQMSPGRRKQAEDLYQAVLNNDPSVGALLLQKADPELRGAVETLLALPSDNGAAERRASESSDRRGYAGTLVPGSFVGPYRIEGQIGAGGMGQVYKAWDTRLGRDVAIKTLREQFNDRFQREARAIAALNHPHICQIHDVGPDYLVLEYIEGKPLRGPLPAEECVRVALEVAGALEEAHARGILHRDLKPGNIMLTTNGSAKLLDFGLAKVAADADGTQTMAIMGTPAYMAPEQTRGIPADARSEIFSFGLVLYEMLTGRQALGGDSAIADEPGPLNAAPSLSAVVNRCLQKLPAARFQTMSEVRAALEQAKKGLDQTDKELNPVQVYANESEASGTGAPGRLEIAHVLFMDLVAFSAWPMEEQRQGIRKLQDIVLSTPQARDAERSGNLIRLPTGDGIALVFFGDPLACVETALDVSSKLKGTDLKLRMGINTGAIYRVADINENLNAAGSGINIAQRIMDAGDGGHILVSKSVADILLPLKQWAPHLHDLGVHPVKHGLKLQFYNLYTAETGNPAVPARFRARSAARLRLRLAVAAACILAAILSVYAVRHMQTKRRSSLAVMGFRNITGRPEVDWVSTGLADGLRTELASTGKLRAISGEESAEMWKDLGLARLDSMGKTSLHWLHNRGADIVIVGSYTDLDGGRIHLDLAIQDTAAGETIDSLEADGTESGIAQLVREAGQRIRIKMGLGQISAEGERQVAATQPSTEAAQLYFQGLAKLRTYEPMQARGYLQRAAISDEAFPFVHASLAEALSMLGYDGEAKEEAKKAFDLSKSLSFEDRTSIEGRYRGMASDWPAAIDAYRRLYNYAPQNLDYGLKLAEAQRAGGKGQDGLATLTSLRKLAKPEGNDPRIDLEEAETAASLGDLKRGLEVASNAAEKAQATGARLLKSRALTWSCDAQRRLGQMDKARRSCEQARRIAMDLGDDLDTARAVNDLANIANDQGDLEAARNLFEQALALARKIGAQRDISGALNNLGIVLAAQGHLGEAKDRYQEALKIQQNIGFKSEIPNTLEDIGNLLDQEGDLAGARASYEQAISAAQEAGNERALAGSKTNLAAVLFEQGKVSEAELECREALALERKLNVKSDLAQTLDNLGDILVARDDLPNAEQSYREALKIQEEMGQKGAAASTKIGLATLYLESDRASQAESTIRPAIQEFEQEKDASDAAAARLVLVKSLLAQKMVPGAEKELGIANNAVNADAPRSLRFSAQTVSAQVLAALGGEGNAAAAMQDLRSVIRDATKAGMPGFELEGRLTMAEIDHANGKKNILTELNALAKDASSFGFLLVAHRAERLAGSVH